MLSGPEAGFAGPNALAVDGPDLLVSCDGSGFLGLVAKVEIPSGAVVADWSGQVGDFDSPSDIALVGSQLLVSAEGGVTELNTSSGPG